MGDPSSTILGTYTELAESRLSASSRRFMHHFRVQANFETSQRKRTIFFVETSSFNVMFAFCGALEARKPEQKNEHSRVALTYLGEHALIGVLEIALFCIPLPFLKVARELAAL